MSIASFSGLASGIQWRDMIDQIMKLEARPVDLLRSRIKTLEAQTSAWGTLKSRLQTLNDAAKVLASGEAFRKFHVSVGGAAGGASPFTATVGSTASPGTYQVRVLGLATSEKLGSDIFSSRTTALGIAGEFRINGVRVEIAASDTLDDIARRINAANVGSGRSGVTASILSTGPDSYRLVLTSDKTGKAGIDLVDGPDGVLRSLGFLDGTTSVKHRTSNGARSDGFASATAVLDELMEWKVPPPIAEIILGPPGYSFAVTLDFRVDSLNDIAAKINDAAALAGSSVTASVVAETVDGKTVHRLDIAGTTSFTDAHGVLEALGILEGGRSAVAQRIQGDAMTDGATGAAATASTLLTDLWKDGRSAGVQVGDTLTIAGTRGDGSAVSITYTIQAGDTLQDLLDRLNDTTDGFGAGSRTATASIDAEGRLVLTDDAGGESRLALRITANNEHGGTLDFGEFRTAVTGRAREIVAGADAAIEIDGAYITRSSNTITDVIPGVTLSLTSAAPDTTLSVTVGRDTESIVSQVQALVDAYNRIADFVDSQAASGGARPPLAGDAILRSIRDQLREALQTRLPAGVAGDFSRLAEIGIEINRNGRFDFDRAKLEAALENDIGSVQRLFGLYGAATSTALGYVGATDATVPGTYAIEITQAATRASVTGIGFGGAYVDDGIPDTLSIRDLATGKTYAVALTNGMTLSQIVDALNAEFARSAAQRLAASTAVYADPSRSTPATDATPLAELYREDGSSAGFTSGSTITFSGRRSNGEAFLGTYTITDASAETLGDLRAAIQAQLGSDVTLAFENGVLTATSNQAGGSSLSLSISSDVPGSESPFGTLEIATEGRGPARIIAEAVGGQLRLTHQEYGSAAGFEISFSAGGADGTASLGLSAGTWSGLDVQGTIGGLAATGRGQTLTGDAGSAVEGLKVSYTGTETGVVGSVTFSRGIGSLLDRISKDLLGSGDGSISALTKRISDNINGINHRIERMEDRLERRREELIRRFTAMEMALARAQTQSQWLTAQIGSLGINRI
jgi:flagellar hook-associated protein 2